MEEELGAGNKKPEILSKLAQYELTLKDWVEEHRGYRKYVAIAGKCWPAFQTQFGFVPCYVNSRLTAQGIPVSCEVDIYGALSEFIGTVVSEDTVTLLDINNTVPNDMYKEDIEGKFPYTQKDTFMGFHCGNTASSKLSFCEMKYQMIMARALPEEGDTGNSGRETSSLEILHSSVCRVRLDLQAAALILHREKYFRCRHAPLDPLEFSQFRRWEDFTVMF
mgnify:CR=1 FL=1